MYGERCDCLHVRLKLHHFRQLLVDLAETTSVAFCIREYANAAAGCVQLYASRVEIGEKGPQAAQSLQSGWHCWALAGQIIGETRKNNYSTINVMFMIRTHRIERESVIFNSRVFSAMRSCSCSGSYGHSRNQVSIE